MVPWSWSAGSPWVKHTLNRQAETGEGSSTREDGTGQVHLARVWGKLTAAPARMTGRRACKVRPMKTRGKPMLCRNEKDLLYTAKQQLRQSASRNRDDCKPSIKERKRCWSHEEGTVVSCEKWEVISLLVRTRRQSPTVTAAHSKRRMRAWWWCSPRSWWFKSWMRLFLGRWKMRRSAGDGGEGDEDKYWADGDLHQRKEKGRRSSWFWSLMKGEWDEGAVRFLQGEQEVLMSEEWMVVRLMVNEREQGSRCGRQRDGVQKWSY